MNYVLTQLKRHVAAFHREPGNETVSGCAPAAVRVAALGFNLLKPSAGRDLGVKACSCTLLHNSGLLANMFPCDTNGARNGPFLR